MGESIPLLGSCTCLHHARSSVLQDPTCYHTLAHPFPFGFCDFWEGLPGLEGHVTFEIPKVLLSDAGSDLLRKVLDFALGAPYRNLQSVPSGVPGRAGGRRSRPGVGKGRRVVCSVRRYRWKETS